MADEKDREGNEPAGKLDGEPAGGAAPAEGPSGQPRNEREVDALILGLRTCCD